MVLRAQVVELNLSDVEQPQEFGLLATIARFYLPIIKIRNRTWFLNRKLLISYLPKYLARNGLTAIVLFSFSSLASEVGLALAEDLLSYAGEVFLGIGLGLLLVRFFLNNR